MVSQIEAEQLDNMKVYILNPQSKLRMIWDIIMIVFVIYNVIILPMQIGLELEPDSTRYVIELFIDMYFACDILLNFFTGYFDDYNNIIMDQKKIIKNYMKFWFWIDLTATFPFELLLGLMG